MEQEFRKVLETLKNNNVSVKMENDGIYVRLAGNSDNEVRSPEWCRIYTFHTETTNLEAFAKAELALLAAYCPDSVVIEFTDEIISLCKVFANLGQSGASAPFVAKALFQTIKKLLNYMPITELTGCDKEWEDMIEYCNEPTWQNNRCSSIFKDASGNCTYLDAIRWKDAETNHVFGGTVYTDFYATKSINSRQKIQFPFTPKTFYINVIPIKITEKEAISRNIDYCDVDAGGNTWYYVIEDMKQLDAVFKYYIK